MKYLYSGHITCYDIIYKERGDNMAYTEAQKKATLKYLNEKTDDIRLRVKAGLKEKYKNEAQKRGLSMTQFIVNCVEKEIENS